MHILHKKESKLLAIFLILTIIITLTSCFGFYQKDPSIPFVNSPEITGDTAADLAILVSWTASDNSGGYNIYRSEDGVNFVYTGSTGPEQLSYIDADEDLVLGSTYTYKISSNNIWHTAESGKSSTSPTIDYFLAPVWESIFSSAGDSPVKIKIANSPANQLFYVYADSTGLLHVGRIIEEEDPEDEDETIFTIELLDEVSFTPKVDPSDPDFDIIYTNNALFIGFADTDQSKNLTVVKITTETEDDVLTWNFTNFGTAGFTPNPVSSISLAANGGGFTTTGTLFAGTINNLDELILWKRPLNASSGVVWENISPPLTTPVAGTPKFTKIFMDGSTLNAAYNNDSSSLDILSRSDTNVWSKYDSLTFNFSPVDDYFTVGTSGNLLTVFSLESGNVWNIQTRNDDSWVDQDKDEGVDPASAGLKFPFSSDISAANMYLFAARTTGSEVLMYDRDIEKWFSYGSPEPTGTLISTDFSVVNNSYYAAWIEGSTAHISIGR